MEEQDCIDALRDEIERRTAFAIGLPTGNLTPEERRFLPSDVSIDAYLTIRNHVVTRWRERPWRYLTPLQAAQKLQTRFVEIVALAWRFLDHHGYINFGVSEALNQRMKLSPDSAGNVIVIGAGLAGLAAARQLRMTGHRVVILEARERIGGRIQTLHLQESESEVVMELGGSVISGIDGNPLALMATQLNIPLHQINNDTPLHFPNGSPVPKSVDKESERFYNRLLDRCSSCREKLGRVTDHISLWKALEAAWRQSGTELTAEQKLLMHWHLANLEFANAAPLDDVSLGGWDQDDPYDFRGAHVLISGGNGQLINAMARDLDILCHRPVTRVKYGRSGVEVETHQEVYKADVVLVTVPLGVLKADAIAFDPPLSDRKRGAIQRLGHGVLNKGDIFGSLNEREEERGKAFLFYSAKGVSGGNVLMALVAGRAAEGMEETVNDDGLVQDIIWKLKMIFNETQHDRRSSRRVPSPLKVICTKWGKDAYSLGSYSSVSVGSSGDDYDIMAENIGDRVFFAGEATSRKYPATMHGALLSGHREAAYITAATGRTRSV